MTLNLRYEIDETTWAVKVYYPDSDAPSLYQPDWPDGTPWSSKDEAKNWAEHYIEHLENPETVELTNTPTP
jgi:hypothetical protein